MMPTINRTPLLVLLTAVTIIVAGVFSGSAAAAKPEKKDDNCRSEKCLVAKSKQQGASNLWLMGSDLEPKIGRGQLEIGGNFMRKVANGAPLGATSSFFYGTEKNPNDLTLPPGDYRALSFWVAPKSAGTIISQSLSNGSWGLDYQESRLALWSKIKGRESERCWLSTIFPAGEWVFISIDFQRSILYVNGAEALDCPIPFEENQEIRVGALLANDRGEQAVAKTDQPGAVNSDQQQEPPLTSEKAIKGDTLLPSAEQEPNDGGQALAGGKEKTSERQPNQQLVKNITGNFSVLTTWERTGDWKSLHSAGRQVIKNLSFLDLKNNPITTRGFNGWYCPWTSNGYDEGRNMYCAGGGQGSPWNAAMGSGRWIPGNTTMSWGWNPRTSWTGYATAANYSCMVFDDGVAYHNSGDALGTCDTYQFHDHTTSGREGWISFRVRFYRAANNACCRSETSTRFFSQVDASGPTLTVNNCFITAGSNNWYTGGGCSVYASDSLSGVASRWSHGVQMPNIDQFASAKEGAPSIGTDFDVYDAVGNASSADGYYSGWYIDTNNPTNSGMSCSTASAANNSWFNAGSSASCTASGNGGVSGMWYIDWYRSGANTSTLQTGGGSSTIDLSNFSVDGTTTISSVTTRDISGRTNNSTSGNTSWKIDRALPTSVNITGCSAPNGSGGWYKGPTAPTCTLSGADATSGVWKIEQSSDGTTWTGQKTNASDGATNDSVAAPALSQGTNTIHLRVTDRANNTPEQYDSDTGTAGDQPLTVKVDTVNPTASWDCPAVNGQNGWNTSDVTCTLTAADSTSKPDSAEYQISEDGGATYGTATALSLGGTTDDSSRTASVTLSAQGELAILRAQSTDVAGNNSTQSPSRNIKIDKTNPTINSTGARPTGLVAQTVVFGSTTATDSQSEIDKIQIEYQPAAGGSWDLLPNTTCANQDFSAANTQESSAACSFDTTNLADGTYNFRYEVIDYSGRSTTSATTQATILNTRAISPPFYAFGSKAPTGSSDTVTTGGEQNLSTTSGSSWNVLLCVPGTAPSATFKSTTDSEVFPTAVKAAVTKVGGVSTGRSRQNIPKDCNAPADLIGSNQTPAASAISSTIDMAQDLPWSVSGGKNYSLNLEYQLSRVLSSTDRAPFNTTLPAINASGAKTSDGLWSASPAVSSYSYQWQQLNQNSSVNPKKWTWDNISGQTTATLSSITGRPGFRLRVTANNGVAPAGVSYSNVFVSNGAGGFTGYASWSAYLNQFS